MKQPQLVMARVAPQYLRSTREVRRMKPVRLLLPIMTTLLLAACGEEHAPAGPIDFSGPVADWPAYGAASGGGHYSAATQIDRENVHRLVKAWEYRSGDLREKGAAILEVIPGKPQPLPASNFQLTPIVVGDTLYGCTSFGRVFALDAATGEQKWIHDPGIDPAKEIMLNCRGVSYWQEAVITGAHCARRIISGTLDGRLLALDAGDGKPCAEFGNNGQVNLREGLGEFAEQEYSVTSPPAIVNDRIVTGAQVLDRVHNHMPGGVVRAYDVRSGALAWYWDPIPPGQQTTLDAEGKPQFRRGTTNVWSIISVDAERDLVFLPTGNTSTDFFGGLRDDLDYWSSSTVALRASTGEVVWHRQWVHHDIWDFDTPAQPTLFELERDGQKIPALAQPTKMGHLFIVNRETGESLFPVEERPVPQDWEVSDEYLAPTQPFPVKPAPLHPGGLSADDAWGFTFWDRGECRKLIASLHNEGIFTPPSLQGSVSFPSSVGGNNWGTPALDPARGLIILNTMFMPMSTTLIPREQCEIGKDLLTSPQLDTPYCVRDAPLLSPLGTPCIAPPWERWWRSTCTPARSAGRCRSARWRRWRRGRSRGSRAHQTSAAPA
jgi:quinoprotein glucose dehydrogenase